MMPLISIDAPDFVWVFLAVVAGFGLTMIVSSVTGWTFGLLGPRATTAGEAAMRGAASVGATQESFLVRLGRTLAGIGGKTVADEDLMDRLRRAGYPYYSPGHYYSRIIANGLIFASMGLVVGVFPAIVGWNLPPLVVLGLAGLLGFWGTTQPAGEVRKALSVRQRDIVVDMAYELPRILVILDAYGDPVRTINEASLAMQPAEDAEDLEEKRAKVRKALAAESPEYREQVQQAFTGFGGNLFAEALNRFAQRLAANESPDRARAETLKHYPITPELTNFFDILVQGVTAEFEMRQQLKDTAVAMQEDLRQAMKEAAAKAKQIVILCAAAQLIPLFIVVGAPVILAAAQLFTG
jgi:hypothetical protein